MYLILTYVACALLAVMASALMLALCVAVLVVQEALRVVRTTLLGAIGWSKFRAEGALAPPGPDPIPAPTADPLGIPGCAL